LVCGLAESLVSIEQSPVMFWYIIAPLSVEPEKLVPRLATMRRWPGVMFPTSNDAGELNQLHFGSSSVPLKSSS
jgi:hypothetical protein